MIVTEADTRLVTRLKAFSCFDGKLIALAGVLVLVGWAIENELLMRILPGFVAMNPLTALCFIVAGIALSCFWAGEGKGKPTVARVGQCSALLLVLVGAL